MSFSKCSVLYTRETNRSVLITDRAKLGQVLEEDPANGIIFLKHLAATLGNRLIETYKMIP